MTNWFHQRKRFIWSL